MSSRKKAAEENCDASNTFFSFSLETKANTQKNNVQTHIVVAAS